MSFGADVGIRFRESMSGHLAVGATTLDEGATRGRAAVDNFKFTLEVSVPRLSDFLDAGVHHAAISGGAVSWEGHARRTPIARDGVVVLYRDVSFDGKRKALDVLFSFLDDHGKRFTLSGEKRLVDRGLDPVKDLSTLHAELSDESGRPVAKGILRAHADEMLDAVASMEVTGAVSLQEETEASAAYLTFVNRQLRSVYSDFPFLFDADSNRFFTASEWRALSLIATVMLPRPLPRLGPTIDETVGNLQSFVRHADREQLEAIRTKLKLLGAAAPLVGGSIDRLREWAKQTILRPRSSSLRNTFELMQRMAALPYFAHPKADRVVGYHRPTFTPRSNVRLTTMARPSPRTFDVVIVGAGVAGSLLAARLTRAGQSVLLLEAGPYIPERDMTTDELVMTARLYKRSGLQVANESDAAASASGILSVLQAACVGGGGTVNNAVCFQLPDFRLRQWHDVGFPVAAGDLRAAYLAVASEIGIKPVSESTTHLNPASRFLTSLGAVQRPRIDQPPTVGLFECLVNLAGDPRGCEGCGLCNTGCGSERKLNALQVYLPDATSRGCELVPRARVVDLRLASRREGQPRRVDTVVVDVEGSVFEVKAAQVVISAGAIGSSALLLRSGDVREETERRGVPVGARFAANVGAPVFGFFDEIIHHRPSLQIAHYYMPATGEGFVLESWFAPPGSLAMVMPGLPEEHWQRMLAYARTATVAPLVGTQAIGTITLDERKAARIELPLGQDLAALKRGMATVARALLAGGDLRPREVVAGTRLGFSLKNEDDVRRFEASITSPAMLRTGTAHPQGGNAMSSDPRISVVDEQFRVRGFANLRVCDASIFPSVAGVNPQWTVMALAHLCAAVMAGRDR